MQLLGFADKLKDTGLTHESVLPHPSPPALPHKLAPAHVCLGTSFVPGSEFILTGDTKTNNGHAVESILVSGCVQSVGGTEKTEQLTLQGTNYSRAGGLKGKKPTRSGKGLKRHRIPGKRNSLCKGMVV